MCSSVIFVAAANGPNPRSMAGWRAPESRLARPAESPAARRRRPRRGGVLRSRRRRPLPRRARGPATGQQASSLVKALLLEEGGRGAHTNRSLRAHARTRSHGRRTPLRIMPAGRPGRRGTQLGGVAPAADRPSESPAASARYRNDLYGRAGENASFEAAEPLEMPKRARFPPPPPSPTKPSPPPPPPPPTATVRRHTVARDTL